MELYTKMLLLLFEGVIVPKSALRGVFPSDITRTVYIERANARHHIKEIAFEKQTAIHSRKIKALTLTSEGLKFLYNKIPGYFQGVSADVVSQVTKFGDDKMNETRNMAYMKKGMVAVFSMTAGAKCSFPLTAMQKEALDLLTPVEDERIKQEIKKEKRSENEANKINFVKLQSMMAHNQKARIKELEYQDLNGYMRSAADSSYILYISPITLRREMSRIYGKEFRAKDYDRCRNIGMLQSHNRSVLMFANFSVGMFWSQKYVSQDISIYQNWQHRLKGEYKDRSIKNGKCGALLIDNPKHLESLYHDKQHKRRKGKSSAARNSRTANTEPEYLGAAFTKFYAVPTTIEGAYMLNRIMLSDNSAEREQLQAIVEKYNFEISAAGNTELFPLRKTIDNNSIPCALLTDMDIRKMQKIENEIKRKGSGNVGVICEAWQLKYLDAIFGSNLVYFPLTSYNISVPIFDVNEDLFSTETLNVPASFDDEKDEVEPECEVDYDIQSEEDIEDENEEDFDDEDYDFRSV